MAKEREGKLVREKLIYQGDYYRCGSRKVSFSELENLTADRRVFPSARTYYSQLYLFIPGILSPSYAQIEAVFELADDIIFAPAAEGFKLCKEVTGFYPLIIPMPDFNVLKEFRFTKNPACVCLCGDLDLEFKPSLSFYQDMLDIGKLTLGEGRAV